MYEFPFNSKNPTPIITYDALINIFDHFIWGFTFVFMFVMFVSLATFQKIWAYASGDPDPAGWLFQGMNVLEHLNGLAEDTHMQLPVVKIPYTNGGDLQIFH